MKPTKQDLLMMIQWGIILAMLVIFGINQCNKGKVIEPMNVDDVREILRAELKETKIDSAILYTKQAVVSNNENILLALADADAENAERYASLQEMILQHTNRVKNLGGEIDVITKLITETKIAAEAPTVYTENESGENEWFASFRDRWVQYQSSGVVGETKSDFSLTAVNEFDLITYEKDGEYFADVLNKNPYTVTMPGTNTFKIQANPKRKKIKWGVTAYAGVGISPRFKTGNFSITPQIGLGIGRVLVPFK